MAGLSFFLWCPIAAMFKREGRQLYPRQRSIASIQRKYTVDEYRHSTRRESASSLLSAYRTLRSSSQGSLVVVSAGRGPYRPGNDALVPLSPISPARVDTLSRELQWPGESTRFDIPYWDMTSVLRAVVERGIILFDTADVYDM